MTLFTTHRISRMEPLHTHKHTHAENVRLCECNCTGFFLSSLLSFHWLSHLSTTEIRLDVWLSWVYWLSVHSLCIAKQFLVRPGLRDLSFVDGQKNKNRFSLPLFVLYFCIYISAQNNKQSKSWLWPPDFTCRHYKSSSASCLSIHNYKCTSRRTHSLFEIHRVRFIILYAFKRRFWLWFV